MTGTRRTAVVVCPGRGTYNKTELGYLRRHARRYRDFLAAADAHRADQGQLPLTELDGVKTFSMTMHTKGQNASPLIYACSYTDFLSIDTDAVEIVAVTGNSMGWYSALACSGALTGDHGLAVVNTMGRYMDEANIGGQAIYGLLDEDWRPLPSRRGELLALIDDLHSPPSRHIYVSIELGGMLVVAGDAAGLDALEAAAPAGPGRFPMRLQNHAAFHTPMQRAVSERALATLPHGWFRQPDVPLVDGRGAIWRPGATDISQLWQYTFGHQVVEPYDFTTAIRVSAREFAPDVFIVLGPGDTLGGAVAQALIAQNWRGLDGKRSFAERQVASPVLLAMGREDQRGQVARNNA